jgi:putative nucleotidyltransferase with HDIG domain
MDNNFQSDAIKNHMTKGFICFDRGTNVFTIAGTMSKKHISCVVITDKKTPKGIITERDMVKRMVAGARDPKNTLAGDVMTSPLFCLDEDTDLLEAQRVMNGKRIRRAIVTAKNGDVIGLITQTDVSKALSTTLESKLHEIQSIYTNVRRLFSDTVKALFFTLDAKDHYTGTHSKQVSILSYALCAAMNLDHQSKRDIYLAALFHDIGKIRVRDLVLNKPGKLLDEEFDEMKVHPTVSAAIVKPISELKRSIAIIRHHHEWYNGKGYPRGLKGKKIPLGSRIITVADCYNAMTTDRPYRAAMKQEDALHIIKSMSGIQFDPEIVKVFLELVARRKDIGLGTRSMLHKLI